MDKFYSHWLGMGLGADGQPGSSVTKGCSRDKRDEDPKATKGGCVLETLRYKARWLPLPSGLAKLRTTPRVNKKK